MQEKDFVSYEYRTAMVRDKDRSRAADMYEAFGWEITEISTSATGKSVFSLKRDRKIPHRQELNRLERQAEQTLDELGALERSKKTGANVFAYTFGIAAALVLGGGMSLAMLVNGIAALAGGIALGVVGIALCGVNYPIFCKLADKKAKQVLPVIDQTEEKFANIVEKGNDLLSANI